MKKLVMTSAIVMATIGGANAATNLYGSDYINGNDYSVLGPTISGTTLFTDTIKHTQLNGEGTNLIQFRNWDSVGQTIDVGSLTSNLVLNGKDGKIAIQQTPEQIAASGTGWDWVASESYVEGKFSAAETALTQLFNDKQAWISQELGYDTDATDAQSVLGNSITGAIKDLQNSSIGAGNIRTAAAGDWAGHQAVVTGASVAQDDSSATVTVFGSDINTGADLDSSFTLSGATSTTAGLMTVADKTELTTATSDIAGLQTAVAGKIDADNIRTAAAGDWAGHQAVVTGASVAQDDSSATVTVFGSDINTGADLDSSFTLAGATSTTAGLMTAADKTELTTATSDIAGLQTAVAGKIDAANIRTAAAGDWAGHQAVVTGASVTQDASSATVTVFGSDINTGADLQSSATLSGATSTTAGLMTAADKTELTTATSNIGDVNFTGPNAGANANPGANPTTSANLTEAVNRVDSAVGDVSLLTGMTDFKSMGHTSVTDAVIRLDEMIHGANANEIHLGQNSFVFNDGTPGDHTIAADGSDAVVHFAPDTVNVVNANKGNNDAFTLMQNVSSDYSALQINGDYAATQTWVRDGFTQAYDYINAGFAGVNSRIDDLQDELRTNLAAANAMSALVPNARSRGNTQVSVGTGGYADKVGFAAGVFHYVGDGTLLNAGVSYSTGNKANIGWRAGATFGF
ncbi:hypothetical protein FACS189421_02530 [Bacteroidia bacterium]|nr:hypothetical protein FACS189421_02530 [Bacteroidia bacterium]